MAGYTTLDKSIQGDTEMRHRVNKSDPTMKALLIGSIIVVTVLVVLLIVIFKDFLKFGCKNTNGIYHDTTGFGCVIREEIDMFHVFYCYRANGVSDSRSIKALFSPQIEMTLSDAIPGAVAFIRRFATFGWLAIDSGVNCAMMEFDLDAKDYFGISYRMLALLAKRERPRCEASKHGDHLTFKIPDSWDVMCVIELESTDGDAAAYDLINKPVPLSLPEKEGRPHANCNDKIDMVGILKTQGDRKIIGFKKDACYLPPMEKGSQIVVAPDSDEFSWFGDDSFYVCVEEYT